jgi:hypothetical protein
MLNCCSSDDTVPTAFTAASAPRRLGAAVEWAIPILTLALVPKCPFCVAAYILFLTGMGVSLSTAAAIRWAMIGVSLAALVWLASRAARMRLRRRAHAS